MEKLALKLDSLIQLFLPPAQEDEQSVKPTIFQTKLFPPTICS